MSNAHIPEMDRGSENLPPTPVQLFRIAGSIIELARSQNRFKNYDSIRLPLGGYRFFPRLVTEKIVNPFDQEKLHHRQYFGVIGKTGFRNWKMRIIEPYQVHDDCIVAESKYAQTDQVRTAYSFIWNRQAVSQARRRILALSDPDHVEYEEMVVVPDPEIYPADMFALANDFQRMTRSDCMELEAKIRAYSDMSKRSGNSA